MKSTLNMTFPQFVSQAQSANVIPLYQEIAADLETPVSAFYKLKGEHCFLLESVEGGEKIGRYSFIGVDPFLLFTAKGEELFLQINGKFVPPPGLKQMGKIWKGKENPFLYLKKLLGMFHSVRLPDLPPFLGGAVGYIGYDAIRLIEPLRLPQLKTPKEDIELMFVQDLVIFDHVTHKMLVVANAILNATTDRASLRKAYETVTYRIKTLVTKLKKSAQIPLLNYKVLPEHFSVQDLERRDARERYEAMVKKAKAYIKAGDIFQVVLSQQFKRNLGKTTPLALYRMLRMLNPSPYLFFLQQGKRAFVGSSPEVMVKLEQGVATLRPIAGTRPRGKTRIEDERLAKELLQDEKELAEHLMLVDLGRNDLGRVCNYRSVQVTEWMKVERYSHVMHLVSQIEGRVKAGHDAIDLIQATFPAGTVSGAPKIRAMEIIGELEAAPRHAYAGLVGYLSFSGDFDSCITIRTIFTEGKQALVQAGAGIVADSDPTREYWESLNKGAAMLKALQLTS